MKAQRQFVHVDEGEIGELAHRVHRHARENSVAPLGQHRHQHAQAAVAQGHDQGRGDQPQRPVRRLHRRGIRAGQRVDRPFEGERHRRASRAWRPAAAPSTRPRASSDRRGRRARYTATDAPASRSGSPVRRICRRRQRFAGAPGRIRMSHQSRAWRQYAGSVARFLVVLHSARHIERLDAACTLAGAILSRFAGICG